MSRTYRIGEAAAITGLSRDTLRFYEKKGLIRSRRLENGYRIYTEEELSALVSILYRRRMNYSLKGIEANMLEEEQQLSDMKRLSLQAIEAEKAELRRHLLSIRRLELTCRDLDTIENWVDRCTVRAFPGVYVIEERSSYMEATMAWFSKSSERDGLDMCYLMSRYETEASGAMRGSRTSLIFYSGMDSELEALLLSGGASYFRYSDQDCVFTVAGIEDDGDIGSSVKRLRAYAREQGLRLSDELYSINLIDSVYHGKRVSYRELYIPVLRG